jgi:Family of unknown function (DUF6252)
MKHKLYCSTFFLLIIFLSLLGCKKHKTSGNPLDQLPPETQTGANTFGCLVDGKVFLPEGPSLSPILQCAYQYLNTNYSQGYFFQLSAKEKGNKECELFSISLGTDSLEIFENKTYQLVNYNIGNAAAQYSNFYACGQFINYNTSSTVNGELLIKKFDEINQIASGTFWFNAVDANGDTVKVTDGRFDMQFTK